MSQTRFAVACGSLLLLSGACTAPGGASNGGVDLQSGASASAVTPPAASVIGPTAASLSSTASAAPASARSRTFDDEAVGSPPVGFSFARTGSGALGRWVVRAEAGAPSGANVLAQIDADGTDYRFPVAVLDEPALRDARVSVRCRTVSGRVDQACGLVARYRDENNYYLTRANALEDNVRLYTVVDGQRRQLASWSGRVTPNAWHEYRLELRGDHLEVFWDGQRVLDQRDATFGEAGHVGVWTKADSVTSFDDLHVEAL